MALWACPVLEMNCLFIRAEPGSESRASVCRTAPDSLLSLGNKPTPEAAIQSPGHWPHLATHHCPQVPTPQPANPDSPSFPSQARVWPLPLSKVTCHCFSSGEIPVQSARPSSKVTSSVESSRVTPFPCPQEREAVSSVSPWPCSHREHSTSHPGLSFTGPGAGWQGGCCLMRRQEPRALLSS